jgi:hypothetical protein
MFAVLVQMHLAGMVAFASTVTDDSDCLVFAFPTFEG